MNEVPQFKPTEEQREIIECFGQGLAVYAGAGCGKTTTLVAKCQRLLEINPSARFAAVSFTERSAADLRNKLGKNLDLAPHWVTTIHGLCGAMGREFLREASLEGEERVLSENEAEALWNEACHELLLDPLDRKKAEALEEWLLREGAGRLFRIFARLRDLSVYGGPGAFRGLDEDLVNLARHTGERYQQLKQSRMAIDFLDLERGALAVLSHDSIAEFYQRRFDLVVVDEFQDTNPTQAALLRRFVRPGFTNLCVVGDPKQSIYRFRDADVSLFEEICDLLPLKKRLTQNYRSAPDILNFVNEVCEPLFGVEKYDSLIPGRSASEKEKRQSVLRVNAESPEAFASWLAREVDAGELKLDESVLLARRMGGPNLKWFNAIRAVGISLGFSAGAQFWIEPRVRELTHFLNWWFCPENQLSGAAFLRAPWMSIPDSTLDQWFTSGVSLRGLFLSSNHEVANRLRLLEEKQRALRVEEVLECFLDWDDDEISNAVLGLWHRACEHSAAGFLPLATVRDFFEAISDERRGSDAVAPANLGCLSVMTVHASKGLEFKNVILIDFHKKARAHNLPPLLWDRSQGAFVAVRTDDGEIDTENERYLEFKERETQKECEESKRVFYVALTRAKERLILVCPDLEERDQKSLQDAIGNGSSVQTDYWRAWVEPFTLSQVLCSKADLFKLSIPVSESKAGRLVPWPKSAVKRVLARTSVTDWVKAESKVGDDVKHKRFEWRAEEWLQSGVNEDVSQRSLGTRVHECLEFKDWEGLKELEEEVGRERLCAQSIRDWWENQRADGVIELSELSFEVPFEDQVLVGAVDSIQFFEAQNLYKIVDYKVVKKTDAVKVLERYRFQIELYAWALGRILVSQNGREVLNKARVKGSLVVIDPEGVTEIDVPLVWDSPEFEEKLKRVASQGLSEV